jgi:aminoglycoside phosphotransferase (APT) family kinase protein
MGLKAGVREKRMGEGAEANEVGATIIASLRRLGLIGAADTPALTPLSGGVSCDIYRVELADGPACVKRPLARLRVAQEWTAPPARTANEVAWLETAGARAGVRTPEVIGHDVEAGLFVMRFLPPDRYPVWKGELAAGRVDPAFAAAVGRSIGRVHARTAGDAETARAFADRSLFFVLRIDPFLLTVARAHPDLAAPIEALAAGLQSARIALVHGDVSPKNILVGPEGPVFLDAETAVFGDPAFDLAFVSSHLLLKPLWRPAHTEAFLGALAALVAAYAAEVDWEPAQAVEARAAALIPVLLLARVDGKSPVDYLDSRARDFTRRTARAFVRAPEGRIAALAERWLSRLSTRGEEDETA